MAQIGMPVEYTFLVGEGSSPALVSNVDGSGNVTQVLWPKGGSPQWQVSASGLVRDDTQETANSWKAVTFTGTVSIESGV